MKKTYTYIVMAALAVTAAILAVSCVRELDIPQPIKSDQTMIHLTPVVLGPSTKAETELGNNTYNENLIENYYWFLFSDSQGSVLLDSGYKKSDEEGQNAGPSPVVLDGIIPEDATSFTVYPYVVANLPVKPESPVSGDEWFEYDESTKGIKRVVKSAQGEQTTNYAGTLAALKTIEFGKNTPVSNNSIIAGQSEFYSYTSATTGVPNPKKFVMRTVPEKNNNQDVLAGTQLTPRTSAEIKAPLKRVAVKIILELHIAEEVDQMETNSDGIEIPKKHWVSDVDHLQIYMLWGSTHGNLAGTQYNYDSASDKSWFYFASPRYAMYRYPDGGEYNASTNSVAGSVPHGEAEPFEVTSSKWVVVYQVKEDPDTQEPIWLWGDDVPSEQQIDSNIGNKMYGDWDYVLDENNQKIPVLNADGTIQRRLETEIIERPYYQINSLPLYSMPIEWNVNDAHAPFIKIILPWKGTPYKEDGTLGLPDSKATEFFYKILIPKRTTLEANACYRISLDLAVLGSEADEVPVQLSGEYHVVGWQEPAEMGGDQSAGRYLKVSGTTLGTRVSYDMYGSSLTIPIAASGPVVILNPVATYPYATSTQSGNLTYQDNNPVSSSDSTGVNFMIERDPNAKFVKLWHKVEPFSTDFTSANNRKDIALITYTFRIALKGHENSYYKDVTVTQYPSIYAKRQLSNGSPFVNGVYTNSSTNRSATNNNNYSLGSISRDGYGSKYFTIVSVSTLAGLSDTYPDWVIGDPRVKLKDVYIRPQTGTPYYIDNYASNQWLRTDLGTQQDYFDNYLVGDKDASNFIAPKFMLASGYGYNPDANSANSNWKSNSERCASYQEDGYPAGRWRVPTEAELLFCATLASNGLIENPFRSGTYYWATSGRAMYYQDGTQSWNYVLPTQVSGARSIRCIYDLWYWGDNPVVTAGDYQVRLSQ